MRFLKNRPRRVQTRMRRLGKRVAAVLAALATLSAPAFAMADGGGGQGHGGGGGTQGDIAVKWTYKESFGTPTVENLKNAIRQAGANPDNTVDVPATEALEQAQRELAARGGSNGRLVGVGFMYSPSLGNLVNTAGHASNARQLYGDAWVQETHGKTYTYRGVSYTVASPFRDHPERNVDNIAGEQINHADPNTLIIAIVLGQNEPPVEVPPTPPTKSIQQGVSADSMVNHTTIRQKTGIGGRNMTITDHISPNGLTYSVSNIHIADGQSNIDSQFDLSWDRSANTVTATRKASLASQDMPDNHEYVFTFDVTVRKPVFSSVSDHADTTWNARPVGRTDTHRFDTWRPDPDKSWILKGADGKWQAVIDPSRSNATGADSHTFLDGDEVGSTVNGTMGAHLVQAPQAFALSDDWTAASYIFKADTSKIRVYMKQAQTDRQSSVADIANTGDDVTDRFDITVSGSKATATMRPQYLQGLKGLSSPRQYTLLVPGRISFAHGQGAAQVREDFGKNPGDELTFCTSPDASHDDHGPSLTNSASETVNGQTVVSNEPHICGYVPPVRKDVVSEASQGGDQDSVDGKAVYPGQRVEYQLLTRPNIPQSLAYEVRKVSWTDVYDRYLEPDRQTLEMMDLNTGRPVPKTKYTTSWDEAHHTFTLTVTDPALIAAWRAGAGPRLQVRFEGTVSDKTPTAHRVGNQWTLRLNNSLTPSNEVTSIPPDIEPHKKDVSSKDPTVSIDGKTMLLHDRGEYRIVLDAHQKDTAYRVWRLGITDDFDEKYLAVRAGDVRVIDETGADRTRAFNIQIRDGVLYVFAKTVDTVIPATGETVHGDPQPSDLRAYAARGYDPLHDPVIDQNLLGHRYTVVLPYEVSRVKDGHVVRNKAAQVENDVRRDTEEVSNPLKPIHPSKDVVVSVGDESVDGKDIYLDHYFLYRLDSSVRPANLAYPQVDDWHLTDKLDPTYDRYTGAWAVYASRDLYATDGQLIARKGEKIAGTGFDTSRLRQGGILAAGDQALFTVGQAADGTVTATATGSYRRLVSDGKHEAGWTLYLQVRRLKVTQRHENRFDEHMNERLIPSNIVWTRTPDQTPRIRIEKYDTKSGLVRGDRNRPSEALTVSGPTRITVRVWNEGHAPIHGLRLSDRTIAGDGTVRWDADSLRRLSALTLRPGEHTDVTGTLDHVTGHHTDRARVTGVPLLPCPTDQRPGIDQPQGGTTSRLCDSTPVEASDDWNGKTAPRLASTGSAVAGLAAAAVLLGGTGVSLVLTRRRLSARHGM